MCRILSKGRGPWTDYISGSQVVIHLMRFEWEPVAPWAQRIWMFLAQLKSNNNARVWVCVLGGGDYIHPLGQSSVKQPSARIWCSFAGLLIDTFTCQALGTRSSEPPSSYSTRILSLNLLKTTIIMRSGLSNFMQEVYVLHLCSSLIITLIVVNVFQDIFSTDIITTNS